MRVFLVSHSASFMSTHQFRWTHGVKQQLKRKEQHGDQNNGPQQLTEAEAVDAANTCARKLNDGHVLAAETTIEQAAEYAAAIQTRSAFNVSRPIFEE